MWHKKFGFSVYRSGGKQMDIIVTQDLTKRYGSILALDSLNLEVRSGECLGLLGPNGAGKSTTIKLLCGLIRPTCGSAYINGFDSFRDPKNALRDVGCLVEIPVFYQNHTPAQILHYLGKLRGLGSQELKSRVKECLELVNLGEWENTKIKKFSLGMVQRLGIAQAILHDPSVLILDEPALGLDPRGIRQMRDLIKSIRDQGKTILFSSHMLHETQEVCTTVALINKGKLLAHDRIDNLEKIFNIQMVEMETVTPLSEQQVEKIRCMKSVKSVVEGRNGGHVLKINFEGDRDTCARLHAELVAELGPQIVSFKPSAGALEEVYLQLVRE